VFVGRAKEGISLNKVMVGYDGWTNERTMINDAIPILADGIKWLGYSPERHWLWSVGWYTDLLSKYENFSTYDNQFSVRLMWVPLVSDSSGTLLHIGMNARNGKVDQGELSVRAKPEAFAAPFFVNTGVLPATTTRLFGPEVYYRPGNWLFGSEYYALIVNAEDEADPVFHGGDVFVSWNITGETRSYHTTNGFFRAVSPRTTVLQGGPGAWEAVLRFTYIDLDAEQVTGGKFWRITPMLNWHLTDNTRFEFVYGYGVLDRFDTTGRTHFLQSRVQMAF
jgi:phosphate-selective porin OprO/OprP